FPAAPRLTAPLIEMRERESRVRPRVVGINRERLLEKRARLIVRLDGSPLEALHPPQPALISGKTGDLPAPRRRQGGSVDAHGEGVRHLRRNLVLYGEQFFMRHVKTFRPEVLTGGELHELGA